LGLTSRATVQHAADIFEEQYPTPEERASIALAEVTSEAPVPQAQLAEFVSDEFRLGSVQCRELLVRSETVGFVDAEGQDADKLYFNGNLFRRDNLVKARRVLDSLSAADHAKVAELDDRLARQGCLGVEVAEAILGVPLFEKLKAAGMYDVNHVANPSGEFGFVTRPAAFHKFNDPLVDDAFDLAKALVAALSYGMTQSGGYRGRIEAFEPAGDDCVIDPAPDDRPRDGMAALCGKRQTRLAAGGIRTPGPPVRVSSFVGTSCTRSDRRRACVQSLAQEPVAVQLDLFCSASHSIEPGAHAGLVGCGLCCSLIASALWRIHS
jgi:hypothetical protein